MRARNKERRNLSTIAHEHEAAGDRARHNRQRVRALAKYERALAHVSALEDETRICDKIGHLLYTGERPDYAIQWFERTYKNCLSLNDEKRASEVACNLARIWLLASNTPQALACIERLDTMKDQRNDNLYSERIEMRRVLYLAKLGRYHEIVQRPLPKKPQSVEMLSYLHFIRTRAVVHAVHGDARRAFLDFQTASERLRVQGDSAPSMVVAAEYADWAIAFGRLDLAVPQYERALFIARERKVKWQKILFSLYLAGALAQTGDYMRARDLLSYVNAYDTGTPILRVLRAIASFRIGFATEDRELLKRAPDEIALELAFQSEEPQQIGPLVANHVKLAVSLGNLSRAKQLIARGLSATRQADYSWELLALSAQFGSASDAQRGKSLLVERLQKPHHGVAAAHFELWEMYAARKKGNMSFAHLRAKKAARLFAQLGWKCQQAEVLTLVGKQGDTPDRHPTSDLLPEGLKRRLTNREQQVAELALRGLTNRHIAEKLSISEYTVESHMSSLLERLELRSRWQLAFLLR